MGYRTLFFFGCVLSSLKILCDASKLNMKFGDPVQFSSIYVKVSKSEELSHADAAVEETAVDTTTPSACNWASVCAYQAYDNITSQYIGDLVENCSCPKDEECRFSSFGITQSILMYRCMDNDTWTEIRDGWRTQPPLQHEILESITLPSLPV